jgi:hypothetical protein
VPAIIDVLSCATAVGGRIDQFTIDVRGSRQAEKKPEESGRDHTPNTLLTGWQSIRLRRALNARGAASRTNYFSVLDPSWRVTG